MQQTYTSHKTTGISGSLRVPGDKSISHRSVIFGSLADGVSNIEGLLEGEDVLATLAAFRAMGVNADGPANGGLRIEGVGIDGLRAADGDLDMGNSGTAMRLMCGLLSAQAFPSVLVGDESLSGRPMRRVVDPLIQMGAECTVEEDGTPPIRIAPAKVLQGLEYNMPVASAQVKSALLLAGLYANGTTTVIEPAPTRDHTERMLQAYGYPVERNDNRISLHGGDRLTACDIAVPADISSAAFFLVLGSIVPNAELLLEHVGINPTRTGILQILKHMGADIELQNQRDVGGEPVADIRIRYSGLKGIDIEPEWVPLAIDEFPVLCIAAACAEGTTRVRGAEELRHKESDRISAMVLGLRAIGIAVDEHEDGMDIHGGEIGGAP